MYRELGLNRVFAGLQVEEIWNCCRVQPSDRSHGPIVIVVRSEGRHHLKTNMTKVFKFIPSKSNPLAQEGLLCPFDWSCFLIFKQLLSGFISVVPRVHTEPSPACLTGPGSVSCVSAQVIDLSHRLEDEISAKFMLSLVHSC